MGQRERAAGGLHVGRLDVILERDRNSVQRAANLAARPFESRCCASAMTRGLTVMNAFSVGSYAAIRSR